MTDTINNEVVFPDFNDDRSSAKFIKSAVATYRKGNIALANAATFALCAAASESGNTKWLNLLHDELAVGASKAKGENDQRDLRVWVGVHGSYQVKHEETGAPVGEPKRWINYETDKKTGGKAFFVKPQTFAYRQHITREFLADKPAFFEAVRTANQAQIDLLAIVEYLTKIGKQTENKEKKAEVTSLPGELDSLIKQLTTEAQEQLSALKKAAVTATTTTQQ